MSAKFELTLFEGMLKTDLHPKNIEKTIKTKTVDELRLVIENETCRIIDTVKNVLCGDYDEHHLERYIQLHVRSATSLLDQAYAFVKPDTDFSNIKGCDDCVKVYFCLKAGLKTILNYIEKELDRYFDLGLPVPDSFRITSARQLMEDRNVLQAKLRSKDVDVLLQDLILSYVSNHCALESCSYLEQKYAKLVMASLLKVLRSNKVKDWNRKVIVELIYLNFNKSTFFTWCRKFIAVEIDDFKTVKEQALRFNWYRKEIKPIDTKPNVFYKPGRPGVKELLEHYIAGELVYLSEFHKGHGAEPVQNFKERAEKFDFKLPLSLSVSQLALFIELFIRTGVFPVEKGKMKATMGFFAANVTTVGTEEISLKSLDNNRRPKPKVCDAIEGILERMLDLLRNDFMK
ncbi:hypothetical protein [Pedobacter frigoris]|uniref:hypothetical protein n=1 Tax=Pedobacter frigoris TaxID=2571272 RepID=UPI002930DD97|nr:hypothetical protein [Pedobacter frigoris]